MRCSVPYCTSDSKSKRTVKSQGITFFKFPKDPNVRKSWLEALGIPASEPKNGSAVCSEHFKEEDFYITSKGLRSIHSEALPFRTQDLEASAALRVCRICLALDTGMHDIQEFDQIFEQITGLVARGDDSARLPQCICWECAARLTSAANLKAKALLSDGLLRELLRPDTDLKIRDIKSINRTHFGLKTSLIQNVYECERFDVKVKDTDLFENGYTNPEDVFENYQNDHTFEILQHEKAEEVTDLYQHEKHQIVRNGSEKNDMKTEMFHSGMLESEENDSDITRIDEVNDNDMLLDEYKLSDDELMETGEENGVSNSETADKDKICEENEELNIKKHLKETKLSRKKRKKVNPERTGKRVTIWSGTKRKIPIDSSLFTITPLNFEEQLEEVEKRRDSEAYKEAPFKCTVCYRGFKVRHLYVAHILRHSDKNGAFECFICKVRRRTKCRLRIHIGDRHTNQYSCKKCNFITTYKSVARVHEKFHAGSTYSCPHCSRMFNKRTSYLNHLRINHMSDYVCEFCGYTFISEKGVLAHKSKKHVIVDNTEPLKGPFCEVCNITFASQDAYDVHYRLSSKHVQSEFDPMRLRNEHRPADENQTYPLKDNQRRISIYSLSPIQCEQCGIELRTSHAYMHHLRLDHPGIPRTKIPKPKTPWMCEECGKILTSLQALEYHKSLHSGQKKYQCDHCKRFFATKAYITFHMTYMHDNSKDKYQCQLCGKQFSTTHNLKKHEFLHTGEKPFQCDLCDKRFPTSDHINQHRNHVHYKKPWPKKIKRKIENIDRVEN